MMKKKETEIISTAFQWRATMADDQVSASDRRAFAAWIDADPDHRAAYDEARQFWQDLGTLDTDALDPGFFQASLTERIRSFLWRGMRTLANCIPSRTVPSLGILGGLCALLLFGVTHLPVRESPTEQVASTYRTMIGERRTIELEDGSRIVLDADTAVKIRMLPDARMVEMGLGEAFFQVAKDANRPFTVTSGELLVTVRGTAFDIHRTNRQSSVSVAEGVVSVSRAQSATSGASTPAEDRGRTLTAGERLTVLAADDTVQIAAIEPGSIAAWRDDQLVYIDVPLADIVADVNRYQPRKIRIRDKAIGNIRITATFDSKNIDGMLASLVELFPIRIEHGKNEIGLHRAL